MTKDAQNALRIAGTVCDQQRDLNHSGRCAFKYTACSKNPYCI